MIADKMVNEMIDFVGLEEMFKRIPEEWQFDEMMFDSKPNKRNFVYYFYWEKYMEDIKQIDKELS